MNFSFWLELLARSAALLITGDVILRVIRHASAALRHRLLMWMLALLALLPVLAVMVPEISLSPWKPASTHRALVTVVEISSQAIVTSAQHSVNWLLWLWMGGMFAACLPLIIGAVSVWRITRRAKILTNEIFISNELRVPMTCGILRPRILLPTEAEQWSSSRLQAVLLHERAHIRRRDLAAQVVAHLVAAVWWFQPLVWIMRRRLRLESEFACDAEAIRSGFRSSDYASELLAVAQSVSRDWRMSSSALAMVRSSDLEDRVRAVLRPSISLPRRAKTYVLGLILGSAAIAASAVNFRSHESWNEPGGSNMKRTMLSALLTSAGLSAATISGTVHDVNGAAIADAKVMISNPDTAAKEEAVTGSDGKFSISGSAAGQYILRIEKPGFASIFREFDLKAESNMERDFTMPIDGGEAVADNLVATNEEQPKKVRVGGQVAQSNLLRKVQPVYPAAAKTAQTQGTVELEAVISKDGVPSELRVVSSPSDDLSASSLEAVRLWRYRPTLLNGNPVSIVTTVIVNYSLAK
jgi:TonB family protein